MVKQSYLDMDKELEFIPQEGIYALPYAANAAGILYNKDMFQEHGWKIPETWNEFLDLCEKIKSSGVDRCIWDIKIPGRALLRGMHWQLV